MKIKDFLEVDDSMKLEIAEMLNSRREEYTSVELLVELLGISKFKVTKYIQELSEDMADEYEILEIRSFSQGELNDLYISATTIRRLRLMYIQKSKIFLLFNEMLYGRVSLGQFSNKYYVSRSKTNVLRNQLTKLLKNYSITIKDGMFIGNEEQLRKVAFEVYYFYFNGTQVPFSEKVIELKNKLKKELEKLIDLDLVLTKKIKVDLFLSILSIRISRKNFLIDQPSILLDDSLSEKYDSKKKEFSEILLSISGGELRKEALNELDSIFLFLVSEECLSLKNKFIVKKTNDEIKKMSDQLVKETFSEIIFNDTVTNEKKIKLKKKLTHSFIMIHFQRYYSFHAVLTFNTDQQIAYFKEAYPQFHKLVSKFLKMNELKKRIHLDVSDEAGLYYDYMFALISCIPLSLLNNKIYICVDFSRGDNYTEYISENIRAFKHLNVVIQQKIDNDTQLFVSDFMIVNNRLEQIIWKNPPTDDDWAVLGDAIVSAKGGQL